MRLQSSRRAGRTSTPCDLNSEAVSSAARVWCLSRHGHCHHLTFGVFPLDLPLSLVGPLRSSVWPFHARYDCEGANLEQTQPKHIPGDRCPGAPGQGIGCPSAASVAATSFRISRLRLPSAFVSDERTRSRLPPSSLLFSAVAPKTVWFCRKRKGSLPSRHASPPMGRFTRLGRIPGRREASRDHDTGAESKNAGDSLKTQVSLLCGSQLSGNTMPRAKLPLSPCVKNSPSSL